MKDRGMDINERRLKKTSQWKRLTGLLCGGW